MTKKERLNELYKNNSLNKEDVYTMTHKNKDGSIKKTTIITRSGIEKIQYINKIDVVFEVISKEVGNIIIKAYSKKGDLKMETYGTASKLNCFQKFPVEIAEKRALARVIIKTMHLTNTLGQDEIDHQGKNVVNK
jgi:hypothetical protein